MKKILSILFLLSSLLSFGQVATVQELRSHTFKIKPFSIKGSTKATNLKEISLDTLLKATDNQITVAGIRALTGFTPFKSYLITDSGKEGIFKYDATDITTPDNLGTVLVDASGRRWKRVFDDVVNVKWFGAITDNTDNSAKVQLAINTVSNLGATVLIPNGIKFNPNNLILPKKINIKYYTGDNLDPNIKTATVAGQLVNLVANADNDGIANEFKIESNLHPGFIINTAKNVNNHNFLGSGQSLTSPARTSIIMQDESLDRFMIQYANENEKKNTSGTYMYSFIEKYTLNGITSTSFSTTPVVNTLITGSISGATGYIFTVTPFSITVIWLSGTFRVGESVINNKGTFAFPDNQVSSTTISSITNEHLVGNPLTFSHSTGYASFGLLPELAKSPLSIGGRLAIQKSRSFGQNMVETINNPSLLILDSYENTMPNGIEIMYNTSVSINKRRLEIKNINEEYAFGEVGAVKAHTGFSNSVLPANSSYNISSIVRNSTGDYTINFINPFKTTDYQVGISNYNQMDNTIIFVRTLNSVRIKNYLIGTSTLQDLSAEVNIIITGGDY